MANIIGSRMKALRENAGLNQKELAKKLDIATSTMSQYESGQRVPSDDLKIIIANFYGVSTDYLLGRTDDPIPVRDVNQDLFDEHDYNQELEAFMEDEELRMEFMDYKDWPEEDKRNLLYYLEGQRARREKNQKN